MTNFKSYIDEFNSTLSKIDNSDIAKVLKLIKKTKRSNGRVFFLGVGGSAANASHAVNDFRKLCNIECYSPADNIAEITARTNDEGWDTVFANWLKVSKLNARDLLFIFSVGGGDKKKKVSINLINALIYAKKTKSKSISIVANKNGYAAQNSTLSIILNVKKNLKTPISETMQVFLWHFFVSHPSLQENKTKW